MPFAWIVPSAVWLVINFTAEACRKGITTSSKALHGTEEICDKGTMTANTAGAIQYGTNVTLSCHLGDLQTPNCKIGIFLNNSEQVKTSGRSVSKTFPVTTYGKHTFTCKTVCEERKKLICGIYIKCGNPPDEPVNVSCIQIGTDSHPLCTWNKGRLTYLDTTYVIQLSNGTHDLCFSEESLNETFGSLALTELNFDSNYTVVVSASNNLGSASSQPLTFTLIDIVKPHPPDFLVEFDSSSATNCTLFWHNEAQAQHYRLRYRPLTRHSWSTVEIFSSEQYHLHELEPDTAYEFQVSCKIHPERGLWSDWSTNQTRTPEAAPAAAPDVWRRLGPAFPNGSHEVTVLIKPLPPRDARGRILGYAVAAETPAGMLVLCNTSSTECSVLVQPGARTLLVTAHNSKGASSPASISLGQGASSQEEFPAPVAVEAKPENQSRVLVHWQPPQHSKSPPLWFIVEWVSTSHYHQEEHYFWKKVPPHETHTYIQEEAAAGFRLNVSVYAVYPGGVSKPSSGKVPPEEPFLGIIYSENPHDDDIRVFLGLSIGMVVSSVGFAILMFKKSVRKRFHSLLSVLLPWWQIKAIPDPANATWAKSFRATKAELSSLSILFLPSTIGFEEPEPTPVEEAFVQPDPLAPGDKLLVGSAGSRGHGDWTRQSSSPEPGEEQQLPELYQRLVVEAMEHLQPVPEYITSPGPTDLPLPTDTPMDHPELDCHPLSIFPTTFLAPTLCYEGNLTLDRVKLNCSSFTR